MTEKYILFLNTMRIKYPETYKRKLVNLGITDSDVPYREIPYLGKKVEAKGGKIYYRMGGKPYFGKPPAGFMPVPATRGQCTPNKKYSGELYLVDGDNHPYEALQGMDLLKECDKVMVYVTQEGLKKNLYGRYGNKIHVVDVAPGDQSVDNKIKSILGNVIKNHRKYKKIHVVSHDKGYTDNVERYRRKYHLGKDELDLRKSIRE